jgi:hypothetical protein
MAIRSIDCEKKAAISERIIEKWLSMSFTYSHLESGLVNLSERDHGIDVGRTIASLC